MQDLPECNEAIEEALLPGRVHRHSICRKIDPITLLGHVRLPRHAGDSPDFAEERRAGVEKTVGQVPCRIERELALVLALQEIERARGIALPRNFNPHGEGENRHRRHPQRQSRPRP